MNQSERAGMFTHIRLKALLIFFVVLANLTVCLAGIKPDKNNIVKDVTELKGLYDKIIPVGVKAPNFRLKDLNGKVWDSKDYLGKQVTLLYFWSVFCPYCQKGLPQINIINEKYRVRGLEILAVNLDGIDFASPIEKFITDNKIKLDMPIDELNKVNKFFNAADPYGVNQTPTIFLVNEDGVIVYETEYDVNYDLLGEIIVKNTNKTSKVISIVIISVACIIVAALVLAYLLFIRPSIIQQKKINELKRRTKNERNKKEIST